MSFRDHRLPLLLAAIITLLNAAKPAVVDDSAYLLFARHIAADPAHPYGFELFWYWSPEPAMEILAPPVLLYWLAAGMKLFGENVFLLKLWLFPFAWVLCLSVRSLMGRFAPGVGTAGTVAFCLSPAVLPLMSVMLDVPALALGAAAVALFVKGCNDRRSWWAVPLAGVCCVLAMQTKYTMLTVPCVMVGYAFTRLGKPNAVAALLFVPVPLLIAFELFVEWEYYLGRVHNQSHFLFHLKGNAGNGQDLWKTLEGRLGYAPSLLGQFGGLACGVSVAASAGIGWPRWVRIPVAMAVAVLVALVCTLPYSWTNPLGDTFDLASVTFMVCGIAVVITALFGLGRAVWKRAADADTLFLVGWVVVETVGMFGMTPFPAARRVIGVCLAVAVLLFHLAAKLRSGELVMPKWAVGFAVGLGVLVWAIDCWDAYPEKVLAEKAAVVAKPEPGRTVWFTGHWGFQWYCDTAGMKHLDPWGGDHILRPGDYLVTALPPDDNWFFRPCPFATSTPVYNAITNERVWRETDFFPRKDMKLELVADWVWLDPLSGQTVPNLYGGSGATIKGRDHPRLRVAVYKVLAEWP